MGLDNLILNLTYNINKDDFKIEGNVKKGKQGEIIAEYLRTQMGQGADKRKSNKRDVYHITIEVDLSYDSFKVSDDIGNKGLRDGILLNVLRRLGYSK